MFEILKVASKTSSKRARLMLIYGSDPLNAGVPSMIPND